MSQVTGWLEARAQEAGGDTRSSASSARASPEAAVFSFVCCDAPPPSCLTP